MHILITGASGFIGNYVAREVLKRGHSVTCIIRRSNSLNLPGTESIQIDLTNITSLPEALQERAFDVVIDSAAIIPLGMNNNKDYFENILMTYNLLKILKENPPAYFLKLSTIDVYKISNKINENTEVSPQNYYSLSKRVSEQFSEFWGKELHVPVCILRLTQIFGPGDRSNKFIPSIIKQIKESFRIRIYGDGSDRRDLLFVEDAARLIVDCCEKRISGIFNLASGKSYSLLEVVKVLQAVLNKNIDIEYLERKKQRIDYEFDIMNLVRKLGQLSLTDLSDALKKTYYQERLI